MGSYGKGEQAVLKSGGPVMTVIATLGPGDATSGAWLQGGWKPGDVLCRWKDARSGQEKTQAFSPEWLQAP